MVSLHLQEIQQKVPNVVLKEAKAAQQAAADSEARLRAADILKRKRGAGDTPKKANKGCAASE